MTFRVVAAAGVFACTALVQPATAQQNTHYPICISGGSGMDCRYYTMQQCIEFNTGIGGDCVMNPAIQRTTVPQQRPQGGTNQPKQ